MSETRKLAAILVSDVVAYSRLAGPDEDRILARLRALRSDLIDPTIAVHHGRIVKRTGDGAIVEFRSAVDAVRCAIEVQNAMVERNAEVPEDRRIVFRIGIHIEHEFVAVRHLSSAFGPVRGERNRRRRDDRARQEPEVGRLDGVQPMLGAHEQAAGRVDPLEHALAFSGSVLDRDPFAQTDGVIEPSGANAVKRLSGAPSVERLAKPLDETLNNSPGLTACPPARVRHEVA